MPCIYLLDLHHLLFCIIILLYSLLLLISVLLHSVSALLRLLPNHHRYCYPYHAYAAVAAILVLSALGGDEKPEMMHFKI